MVRIRKGREGRGRGKFRGYSTLPKLGAGNVMGMFALGLGVRGKIHREELIKVGRGGREGDGRGMQRSLEPRSRHDRFGRGNPEEGPNKGVKT